MIRGSIRRPVAVAMAYAAVALLGVAAWRGIPIELLPDTQLPQLTVRADWPGASPETVEAFLTSPLESAIQQVRGVERIVSVSAESNGRGSAQIQVEFARTTDMDFARLDLSERLAALEETLPPEADRVVVEPHVPEEFADQNRPFLGYTFTGPYTLEALRRHVDEVVAPEVQQVEGVAVVRVFGGRERRLEVRLDEEAVAALGLEAAEVRDALASLDLVQEAGAVREDGAERTVTIVNRPERAQDVRDAVLLVAGGTPVRVSDVGTVHDTWEEARSYHRIDGRAAVTFEVTKALGANTVRVADAVKARLDGLDGLHPYGTQLLLDEDESEDIREQFAELRTRAGISALVIFLVLLGFLRSGRAAGLVFLTIAFSILIALNLVYFGGLTLNLLTLMGLAMGFGLIVDNSIVVLENVHRRRQSGEETEAAAERGAREVVLPILASTVTTLIVFLPFVYLQGELRVFYVPLAVVVGLTLLASLAVAFTLIPALAARMPDVDSVTVVGGSESGGGARPATSAGPGASRPLYLRFYADLVGFTTRHPWVAIGLTALVFSGSYYLFDRYVSTWQVWGGGWGARTYISVFIDLPRGADLERTDELVDYFEERLARMPEVERFTADVQANRGYLEVTFPDSLENTGVPPTIKDRMMAFSHSFTGAEVRVYGYGPSFYGGGSSPPNYAIQVLGYNYERVRDIAENIGQRLERLARVQEVDTNAASRRFSRDRASEFVLRIDRDRLARHDLNVQELVAEAGRGGGGPGGPTRRHSRGRAPRRALARHDLTVQELVAEVGSVVGGQAGLTRLKLGGEEVQVQVRRGEADELDVLQLRETLVETPAGRRIRLADVVTVEEREVLSRIRRENQQYERTVAYEFRGPQKLGDLFHTAVMDGTEVPAGYTVEAGDTGWAIDDEERAQIGLVMALALLLVYMVTAALFESLLQPLCILLTVPMALIGVFLTFYLVDASFTREAYIGVIMMLGIVVNNAILLVDHVNGVRAGRPELPLAEAVLQGTLERVRPILMTTATTVLGLLPLVVFGDAAGSNIWDALALVLIGGLLASTLFVLTVTPAVYGLLEGWAAAVRGSPGGGPVRPESASPAPPSNALEPSTIFSG